MASRILTYLAVAAAAVAGAVDGGGCDNSPICYNEGWPTAAAAASIGQPSGVYVLPSGDVIVFHRGDRSWGAGTFTG